MSVESSVRRSQILTFSLVWLAYFVTYLLRKPLGVVKTDIAADLGLSKAELGWCDTALVLPYAGVQIFLPAITDRYNYTDRKLTTDKVGPKQFSVSYLSLFTPSLNDFSALKWLL